MKKIDFEQNFSELMYNLKNRFNILKLLASNVTTFVICGTTVYILYLNNFIPDINMIYDIFLYGGLIVVPLDIRSIKKIRKEIKENKKSAKVDLNNLIYKLQKENVYINVSNLENSIQNQKIDYDNKKIHTKFYLLDKHDQIKVLEEIKKLTLFQTKENLLYLLDNSEITDEDQKYIKKLKK